LFTVPPCHVVAGIVVATAAATTLYAASLERDNNNNIIQAPAYHGGKAVAVGSPAATVYDLRQDVAYSVYCAGAANERLMYGNYTAASKRSLKAAAVATTIPATTWHGGTVNKATPFLNLTGCVGFLRRQ